MGDGEVSGSRSASRRSVGICARWAYRKLSARPRHHAQKPRSWRRLKKLRRRLAEIAERDAPGKPIEVWFQDEARIGQKNKITRRWASAARGPSRRTINAPPRAYIFGAICPERGVGAGLVLPWCNNATMALHLAEISQPSRPARTPWSCSIRPAGTLQPKLNVPANISLLPLPPKSPELNPTENVWQYHPRQLAVQPRVHLGRHIVDHCCDAWNKLIDQPWTIMSIGLRTGPWVPITEGWY